MAVTGRKRNNANAKDGTGRFIFKVSASSSFINNSYEKQAKLLSFLYNSKTEGIAISTAVVEIQFLSSPLPPFFQ
jgi:hypothetical protein